MHPGSRVRLVAALISLLAPAAAPAARAQTAGAVSGTVTDAQNLALPGVAVVLRTGGGRFVASTTTGRTGGFALPEVAAGDYVLSAALLGFATHTETIAVGAGGASTAIRAIRLEVGAFAQEVTVSALMPEVATELTITAAAIERRVAQDLAQSLRDHAGVTALRRGAINLDPSVRGLYAEQIGVFVDGTRTFAAGPARMDSGLSHVSPHALQSLRVVRGPYALTWGAGTLSAIRADTFRPAFSQGAFDVGGRAGGTTTARTATPTTRSPACTAAPIGCASPFSTTPAPAATTPRATARPSRAPTSRSTRAGASAGG